MHAAFVAPLLTSFLSQVIEMLGEGLDEIEFPLEMLELKLLPSSLSAYGNDEDYVDIVLSDCSWCETEKRRSTQQE